MESLVRITTSLFGLFAAGLLSATVQAAEPVAAPAVAAPVAAVPVAAVPVADAAKPDRMQQTVCRKDKVIGSLVSTKKTCHTRAQWAYIDDTNQAFSRDLVDTTRTKSGGN
jgi:hypothetical protein